MTSADVGASGRAERGLAVGDWHDLPRILADFQAGRYPTLIEVLLERGPYGLVEMAQEQYGYKPLLDGYAGRCHLCVDVRRPLVETSDFEELRPQGFYEVLRRLFLPDSSGGTSQA